MSKIPAANFREGKWFCPICKFSSEQRTAYNAHYQAKHALSYKFVCEDCSAGFNRHYMYIGHARKCLGSELANSRRPGKPLQYTDARVVRSFHPLAEEETQQVEEEEKRKLELATELWKKKYAKEKANHEISKANLKKAQEELSLWRSGSKVYAAEKFDMADNSMEETVNEAPKLDKLRKRSMEHKNKLQEEREKEIQKSNMLVKKLKKQLLKRKLVTQDQVDSPLPPSGSSEVSLPLGQGSPKRKMEDIYMNEEEMETERLRFMANLVDCDDFDMSA